MRAMAHNHNHNHSAHSHDDHDHDRHDHKHGLGHHHHPTPQNFTFAFALAIALNLAFTLIQAGYAFYAHSMSLLADAGHNLGDVLGLSIAAIAMWLVARKASDKYSYGFKRTTILAAVINALILLCAVAVIITESIHKLFEPQIVNEKVVIIVALLGIAVNGSTALLFMRGQDDLNIRAAFLHLISDAFVSFGVVVTGALLLWTHWYWLDPIVGILIAITIFLGTWKLLRQSVDMILDAVPHTVDRPSIERFLLSEPNIVAIHDLHIWGLSTKETALTAHLLVAKEPAFTDAQLHKIHHDLEHHFKIKHATLQIEHEDQKDNCHRSKICR
jgi:cobalt-zinc-cadmium efflux system protein